MHPLPPPSRAPRRWPYIAGSAAIAVVAAATVSVVLLQSSGNPANAADEITPASAPTTVPATTAPPTTQAPTTTSAPTTVAPTTAAPTTTAAPQPPVVIQQQPPVIIQQPPVVIQQAPPVYDPNLIPPGTIEDGVHYGYLTDVAGMYQLTFDRVDVAADGTWTNTNAKLRTMPTDPSVWAFSYKYAGQPIQVIVQSQRVVGVYAV